ncbi:hypothetical protein IFM89_024006 [Coptis chinensis]|uniref:Fe-S cluster assembly protein SufB n=1 Tax=Coptis chinensis TaxID=261450 RepID=A0A835LFE6_9MAGN|nr:hypothetical protein IFM89_024006 [Coptis chinensis]
MCSTHSDVNFGAYDTGDTVIVSIQKGISVDTIRLISSKKNEPEWMLEFRLKSFEKFLKLKEPQWSDNRYPSFNFQDICYYSEMKKKPTLNSLDEADLELLKYLENRLANVAVVAVFDSV